MLRLDGYTVDYIEPAGGKISVQFYIMVLKRSGFLHWTVLIDSENKDKCALKSTLLSLRFKGKVYKYRTLIQCNEFYHFLMHHDITKTP